MKRFLLFALCAIVALASCQRIDENGVNPGQSALKVTAVIADNATRVDYEVVDNTVNPEWAVEDEIFGYDGTNTFTFTVTDVDEKGMATFDAGDYTPTDGTTLYAVYYPAERAANFTAGELAVDLTSQDGVLDGTAPAIMCATANVEGGEVSFKFVNQTAIIGVKKFQVNPGETVSTFKASGLVATGTIKVVGEALALVPDTTPADITITCNYAADAKTGMYENPVYFIAMPTAGANIVLNAAGTSLNYAAKSVASDIEAGNYYYMSKKLSGDPVARYSNDGGTTWTYTTTFKEAVDGANGTSTQHAKVELLKDAAHDGAAAIDLSGKYIDIDGCGYTYDVSSRPTSGKFVDNAVFTAFGGSTVKGDISFTDITFDGKDADNTAVKSRLIYNKSAMSYTFGEKSYMKDITFQAHGENVNAGGVLYNELGTYTFDGLTATNCCTKNSGEYFPCGGLIDNCGGTVNLESGLISGCKAFPSTNNKSRGGFAYVTNIKEGTKTFYGELNINGGTIDGGSAVYGGVAYIAGSSTVNVNDGQIINCSATYGGAFHVYSGTLNINGGTISGCSVTGSGGAVYNEGGEVEMSAGTISNCKATANNGGAVYNLSTVNMNGGTISGCSSVYGGGIDNRKTLNFTGGTITECSASTWGGGIYNTGSGTTTIDGGEISACTGSYGAGISVYNGTVTLNSGSVSADKGNPIAKANNSSNTCTININGGSVFSSATGGSAISFDVKGGTLNVYGGTIEAQGSSAYAVYNYQCTVNIEDGTLTSAYRVGYVKAGSTNINGGLLQGNDGIYVVSSTAAETKLIIKGGEMNFTNSSSNCAWFYTNSASDKIITLDVQGGKFKCGAYVFGSTGSISGNGKGMPEGSVKKISGGLFYAYTGAMSTMASNAGCKFSAEKNADGYYTVIPQ